MIRFSLVCAVSFASCQLAVAQAPPSLKELLSDLRGEDIRAAQEAACALSYLGPKAEPAIPDLLVALDDVRLRILAGLALVAIGPTAIPPLVERLHQRPTQDVGLVLAQIGGPVARHFLIQALKSKDRNVAAASAYAFVCFKGEALPELRGELARSRGQSRGFVAKAMSGVLAPMPWPDVKILDELEPLLRDDDPWTRVAGVSALAQLGPCARHRMRRVFREDRGYWVRRAALEGLATLCDIGALQAALQDPEPWYRARAAALLEWQSVRAKPAIVDLGVALLDPDPSVRVAASRALYRIGTPAQPMLLALLGSTDPAVRSQAARTLAGMDRPLDGCRVLRVRIPIERVRDVVPALVSALRGDGDGLVRESAAAGLADFALYAELTDREKGPLFAALMSAAGSDQDERVRRASAFGVGGRQPLRFELPDGVKLTPR